MRRRTNPAVVAAPAAAGIFAAHAVAYRLVPAEPVAHDYLAAAPAAIALLAAVALAALGLRVARGRPAGRVPAWPFAALPPLAFALQEHLERLLPTGEWPLGLAGERVFLVGLALQLPFALLAYALARSAAAAADGICSALARRRPPLRSRPAAPRPASAPAAPVAALVDPHAARGPPRLSVG